MNVNNVVEGSRRPCVAVVIPCLDEAPSIGKVVKDFRAALPDARIVVVDNGSTDATAVHAREAGAEVVRETRRGKGFALLTGVRHASPADIFVMVDGDDTYPAESVHELLAGLEGGADQAIGVRLNEAGEGAFPYGHSMGNRLFITIVRALFGIRTQDLFSGFRALTGRFLEESPLIARGFEIEAELSLQAFVNGFRVAEVPVRYRARTVKGSSKLHTVRDGYRILMAILTFFRDYRPLTFFGGTALLFFLLSFCAGGEVIQQYLSTGQVLRLPLAILATGLFLLGTLSITTGILLSAMNRRSEEMRSLLLSRRV